VVVTKMRGPISASELFTIRAFSTVLNFNINIAAVISMKPDIIRRDAMPNTAFSKKVNIQTSVQKTFKTLYGEGAEKRTSISQDLWREIFLLKNYQIVAALFYTRKRDCFEKDGDRLETLPCSGCRGLCCGPVSITAKELTKIKKKVKSMPKKIRMDLENQQRYFGTCIFYDQNNDKCGIYSARPEVCQVFGYHQNMVCFRNPSAAVKENFHQKDESVGILSVDYTWKDF
jgi:Fe-S-cluster containining protein